jgi:ATP-dependent Clp protease ATP-binding subunit ClpA
MNWFKSFWKAFSEPVPPYKASGGASSGITMAGSFAPARADEAMNNFTPRAQQVLALSREEANRFNHNFVGTEHLLLGLIKLGQGVAVNVLANLGLDLETVRMEIEKQVGTGPDQIVIGNIPYTPRVKKVLALASKEAQALNHTYVGTEHILLGILREGDGVAGRVLKNLEVDIEQTRREILKELDPNSTISKAETRPLSTSKTASAVPITTPADPHSGLVDTSKRYDVYCSGRDQDVVVYRNALFKGVRKLIQESWRNTHSEFYELEQANGQTIFVACYSVVKFCEPDVTPDDSPCE